MNIKKTNEYSVPNLERALAVMELLSKHPKGLTRTELADILDIPSNSAYRISMSLFTNSYISRDEKSKKFFLGNKLLGLKCTAMDEKNLTALSWELMKELRDEIGESIFLAVRNGITGVVLESVEGLHAVKLRLQKGHTFQLNESVAGKVFLAHLPAEELAGVLNQMSFEQFTPNTITSPETFRKELSPVRDLGYAIDREESMEGLNCLGTAIRDEDGYPVAVLYTIALKHCLNDGNFTRIGETVCSYADRISTRLQHGSEV